MSEEKFHEQSAAETKCIMHLRELFPPTSMNAEDADFLTDDTFLRFARARNSNLKKAEEMLTECIKWRREFMPYSITADDVEQSMRQATLTVAGRCLAGHPVVVMTIGVPNNCTTTERVNHIVYMMEEFRRRGYEKLTWLIDFSEMGKHPRDPRSSETRKKCTKILNSYYPGLLGTMILFHTPWYVRALLVASWPFVDKETYSKIHVVNDKDALSKFISKSFLLTRFGGSLSVESEATPKTNGPTSIGVNGSTTDNEKIIEAERKKVKYIRPTDVTIEV